MKKKVVSALPRLITGQFHKNHTPFSVFAPIISLFPPWRNQLFLGTNLRDANLTFAFPCHTALSFLLKEPYFFSIIVLFLSGACPGKSAPVLSAGRIPYFHKGRSLPWPVLSMAN